MSMIDRYVTDIDRKSNIVEKEEEGLLKISIYSDKRITSLLQQSILNFRKNT